MHSQQETDIKSLAAEPIEKYADPTFAQPITRHRGSQQSGKTSEGSLMMANAQKYDAAAHLAKLSQRDNAATPSAVMSSNTKTTGSASKIK